MSMEALNNWGAQAMAFAWPMFWQSSLLILVLFAVDGLLRRRLRPAVRYGLWLVLFAKLLLPPTLALPSGLAWWMRPPAVASASATVYTEPAAGAPAEAGPGSIAPVSHDTASAALSLPGMLLMASALGTVALLFYAFLRGRLSDLATPSDAHPRELAAAFTEAKRQARFGDGIALRLTYETVSPGACGLLRPFILVPRLLAEQLSPEQLRAVLLHELFHFKRRDVWVNCLQTLLQVVYWWHPLLWLANARIRRLREEAVDDAVMLTLKDSAPVYPDALVRVARLALRVAPSLGIVGMVPFKKPLRRRVERLLNCRPPRRAGLTGLSIVGIAIFSAAAIPMAQPPGKGVRLDDSLTPVQSRDQASSEVLSPDPVEAATRSVDQPRGPGDSGSPPNPGPQPLSQPVAPINVARADQPGAQPVVAPEPAVSRAEPVAAPEIQPTAAASSAPLPTTARKEHVEPATPASAAVSTELEPAVGRGDPMLPQVLPWIMQQDLERARARVHSLFPPLVATDQAANTTNGVDLSDPVGLKHALRETRRATTNAGVHMAGRVNTVLGPLVKVHNQATEIGVVPRFLVIGPPPPNAPPDRRVPILGDLPILGRLFVLPPKWKIGHRSESKPPARSGPTGVEEPKLPAQK